MPEADPIASLAEQIRACGPALGFSIVGVTYQVEQLGDDETLTVFQATEVADIEDWTLIMQTDTGSIDLEDFESPAEAAKTLAAALALLENE